MNTRWISTVLAALTTLAAAQAQKTFVCPPAGDPFEICWKRNPVTGKLEEDRRIQLPFARGRDINGDGKKDVGKRYGKDAQGNEVWCWCVQKSPVTAQQFYYAVRNVPPPGVAGPPGPWRWFGGCFFPNGINGLRCRGKDTDGDGKADVYVEVAQDNIEKGPAGTHDKHFKMFLDGPNKGKIQKFLTRGRWNNGKYRETSRTPCPITTPPQHPHNLQSSSNTDNSGFESPSFGLVADTSGRPTWVYTADLNIEYVLNKQSVRFAAEDSRTIVVGQTLTITGSRLSTASVTGDAASAKFGKWVVDSVTSTSVRYRATVPAVASRPFAGFSFKSPAGIGTGKANLGARWATIAAPSDFTDLGSDTGFLVDGSAPIQTVFGALFSGGKVFFGLDGAPPSSSGFFVLGTRRVDIPLLGLVLAPSPDVLIHISTDALGRFSTAFATPSVPRGAVVFSQFVIADPNSGVLGASNAFRSMSSGVPDIIARVSATGSNSFNAVTTSGFWRCDALSANPGKAIVQLTLDWRPSSQATVKSFDTAQTGMADRFDGGTSRKVGCRNTFRNKSDAKTGLVYKSTAVSACDPAARTGWVPLDKPSEPGRYAAIQFKFKTFGRGASFEFDVDTDGGGVTGADMDGLVITVMTADGSHYIGRLNKSGPQTAELLLF